jgi:hypothetical protein
MGFFRFGTPKFYKAWQVARYEPVPAYDLLLAGVQL